MELEHSDLTDPEQIEIAIDRAIHNEARARFVAAELKALSQATKPMGQMREAAKLAAWRITSRATKPMGQMREAAKLAAWRITSRTQISKLRTRTHDVAARRGTPSGPCSTSGRSCSSTSSSAP
jgi:hypothetical protein